MDFCFFQRDLVLVKYVVYYRVVGSYQVLVWFIELKIRKLMFNVVVMIWIL